MDRSVRLGCVVWELCTGNAPFGTGHRARLAEHHLYEEPPKFEPRYEVPDDLEAWLRRLLTKDTSARFPAPQTPGLRWTTSRQACARQTRATTPPATRDTTMAPSTSC